MGVVWSTHVGIYFVFFPVWDGFGQRFESSLACDRFGQLMLRYMLSPRWHSRGLSTLVLIHIVLLLAWDAFGQHKFRYILCPRRLGVVNTCINAICVFAGMGGVRTTHFEIHFESSLVW
jgi:hypothetical protein